jgi:hypothetical protein
VFKAVKRGLEGKMRGRGYKNVGLSSRVGYFLEKMSFIRKKDISA